MLTPFGHEKTFGGMVGSFWLNMDPGGCPGIRVMRFWCLMSLPVPALPVPALPVPSTLSPIPRIPLIPSTSPIMW